MGAPTKRPFGSGPWMNPFCKCDVPCYHSHDMRGKHGKHATGKAWHSPARMAHLAACAEPDTREEYVKMVRKAFEDYPDEKIGWDTDDEEEEN